MWSDAALADGGWPMRIEFVTEGGIAHFPGLSRPVMIDGTDLSAEEGAELTRLVEAARFFEQSTTVGRPPPGAADYRQYTITVEDGGRQHTVKLTDPVEDPALQQLLHFMQRKARELPRGR
jgi:hypothetical protein